MRAVATTSYATVAVTEAGEVWTWGEPGLLGDGSLVKRLVPAQMVRPPGMGLVRDVQGVYSHVVALTENGELWAWGGGSGALDGIGLAPTGAAPIRVPTPAGVVFNKVAVSPFYAIARDTNGGFWSWGSGQGAVHQLSVPSDVVDIDTGYYFQQYRTKTGQLYSVGSNNVGQLGDGTTTNRAAPVAVLGLGAVSLNSAGGGHGLAIPRYGSGSLPGEVSPADATAATEEIRSTDEYATSGDPVDVSSGALTTAGIEDLSSPAYGMLFSRSYSSRLLADRSMGRGWVSNAFGPWFDFCKRGEWDVCKTSRF
jgi:Regulator of chromosome condensation (RCC1) repeat/Domain of unknown function (DUF6531)